jgi:predicted transcriptional regulator
MFVDWQVAEVDALPTEAVGRFMTRDVVTVSRFTPIRELARRMVDAHIHRIVVTDDDNTPVGIVTSTDILGAVARSAEVGDTVGPT